MGDHIAEARTEDGDEFAIFGIGRDKLGAGFREGPAGVVLEMPFGRDDMAQEMIQPGRIVDQSPVEEAGIPFIQNIADIENDGARTARTQPWRALKRRFVLLMT